MDQNGNLPQAAVGLDCYIKHGKKYRRRGNKTASGGGTGDGDAGDDGLGEGSRQGPATTADIVKCPVCGDFEGDEAAVAHHVAGHFDT